MADRMPDWDKMDWAGGHISGHALRLNGGLPMRLPSYDSISCTAEQIDSTWQHTAKNRRHQDQERQLGPGTFEHLLRSRLIGSPKHHLGQGNKGKSGHNSAAPAEQKGRQHKTAISIGQKRACPTTAIQEHQDRMQDIEAHEQRAMPHHLD